MTKKYIRFFAPILFIGLYYYFSNKYFGYFCPSQVLVGFPCPGCGMTRAMIYFIQGDFSASFHMHPLFIPTGTLISLYVLFKFKFPEKLNKLYYPAISLIIFSFLIFIIRFVNNFGTEPLVFNENSLFRILINIHFFKKY